MASNRIRRTMSARWLRPAAFISLFFIAASAQEEPRKVNFAVIDIKNADGVSKGEAEIIADRLRTDLFRTGKVSMMERDQMQEILKEQGFQQTGACTDDACMVQIGQMLGVERLVSGSIGKLGSMFLVNFRTIDVQTGKITKVVSVDIKGGIEDVVGKLPGLAMQLAEGHGTPSPAATEPPPAPVTPEAVTPEAVTPEAVTPEAVTQPEPAPPVAPPVVEEKPEVSSVDGNRASKNKNRTGVKLQVSLYPGRITHSLEEEIIRNGVSSGLFTIHDEDPRFMRSENAFPSFQFKVSIKAGQFFCIDFGPGLQVGRETWTFQPFAPDGFERRYTYVIPYFHLGPSFVMRFAPVKFNAGLICDFTMPVLAYENQPREQILESDSDIMATFAVALGGRVGVEIMLGQHVGLSVETQIRRSGFTVEFTDTNSEYDDIYGWIDIERITREIVVLPVFGLGFGLNFYF